MRIDKYLICGGEDLSVLIKSNQSSEALVAFKKWRPFCSESCNKIEKDCLLYIPLSNGNYFLMKSVFEDRNGARSLVWTLGIELTESDFSSIGSYDSMSKGFRNITTNQIKNAYGSNGKPFDVNFRFPQNTFIEEYSFEDIKDKDFKGQYPQILDEFTGKLSNSSLEILLKKLCVAVNPYEYREEFTCMVGTNIPARLIKKHSEAVVEADIIQEKTNSLKKIEVNIDKANNDKSNEECETINNTSNYVGAKNLSVVLIILVVSISLNLILFIKNIQLSKKASEINQLNAVRISLEESNKKQKAKIDSLKGEKIQADEDRNKAQEELTEMKKKVVTLEEERNKANNENNQTQKKLNSIKSCLKDMKKSSKGLKTKIDNLEDGNKKYGGYSKNEWKDNHSKLDEKITEIDNLLN